jgi:hypothetical protein
LNARQSYAFFFPKKRNSRILRWKNKILNSKEWRVESQNYKAKRGRKGRQAYNTLLLVLLEAVPVPPPPVVGTLRRLN